MKHYVISAVLIVTSVVSLLAGLVVRAYESDLVRSIPLNPSERITQLKSQILNKPQKNLSRLDQAKKLAIGQEDWRFPYFTKTRFVQTQGYNGPFSHQGVYALDLANGDGIIVPTKSGTLTTLNFGGKWDQWCNSNSDCFNKGGVWRGNHAIITHLDGSQSYYLHMRSGTLFPGITQGAFIEQGTPLAKEGGSGYTCGDLNVPCSSPFTHLHFQVARNSVTFPTPFADCGFNGNQCINSLTKDDTYYTSTNIATGLVINAQDKAISLFGSNSDRVMLLDANQRGSAVRIKSGSSSQLAKWTWLPSGEIKGINDWCLTANGTSVVIQDCNGQNEQKWRGGLLNSILNIQTTTCLTASNGDNENSLISLSGCEVSRSQRWRFGNQGYSIVKFPDPI